MKKIITPGHPDFHINRKRYVEIEPAPRLFRVEGFYHGCAIKPGFGVVREFEIPVPNIITNTGLNAMASGFNGRHMHLGTGTTTPSATDTALATFGVGISSFTEQSGVSGSSPYYGWSRLTWTSTVGGATGNWTEIGVSNQATTGNLRSRALILDGGGSPTTFTVQSDEQFRGSYELRLYAPESDDTRSVNLSGTPYDVTTRAIRVTQGVWHPYVYDESPFFVLSSGTNDVAMYSGGLAAVTASNPSGSQPTSPNASSVSAATYTSDNYYRDLSARWGSGAAVGTCQTALMALRAGALQVRYDPSLTKLTTEEVIFNQRVVWARR